MHKHFHHRRRQGYVRQVFALGTHVPAGWRQAHALFAHFFAVERVRQLDQNTGAVAHQFVGTDRTAVVQFFSIGCLECKQPVIAEQQPWRERAEQYLCRTLN